MQLKESSSQASAADQHPKGIFTTVRAGWKLLASSNLRYLIVSRRQETALTSIRTGLSHDVVNSEPEGAAVKMRQRCLKKTSLHIRHANADFSRVEM